MTNFKGNDKVSGGYYLSTSHWNVEVIPAEGGTLPGAGKFLRVPFPLLFAVVPFIGLLFLMFLPAIGFGLFAYAIARKITGHVSEHASALAATVTPEMAHGAAYLTGAKGEEKAAKDVSEEHEKLEKEVEKRRNEYPAE
jgi:hypothetical protein